MEEDADSDDLRNNKIQKKKREDKITFTSQVRTLRIKGILRILTFSMDKVSIETNPFFESIIYLLILDIGGLVYNLVSLAPWLEEVGPHRRHH